MKRYPTAALFAWVLATGPAFADEPLNFSRDVLPILSDNCFACHGPDKNKRDSGLRLDLREDAIHPAESGDTAIVPGKPEASELMARILSTDRDEVMPPPKSHKPRLTDVQIGTLRRWIAKGAVWGKHWAFEKPVREADTPVRAQAAGGQECPPHFTLRTPLDRFVWERLKREQLQPSPEAARHTLIRRVSFDLTGLPPTPEEVDAFVADKSPQAYEKVVKRLLDSPHFGERMAMWWLDAARYADTDGFQGDATRTNWPWRDWVAAAFNANKPFDQFTVEQFAGDLLPDATAEQKLATCFHRNHLTNGEGGRDPEESRVDYVIDRVNTVGTTWLGLTLGCAQCHAHKFDPISHADYYSLSAFFNSIDEDGKAGAGAKPYLSYQSPLTARALADAQRVVDERAPGAAQARKDAEQPFAGWLAARLPEVREGFAAWQVLKAAELEAIEGTQLAQEADGTVQASGPNPNQDDYRFTAPVKLPRVTGLKLEVLPHAAHTGGAFSRGKSGEFILTDIKVQVRRKGSSQIRDIAVASAVADFSTSSKGNKAYGDVKGTLDDDPRNGWTTKGAPEIAPHVAVFALAEPLALEADEELVFELRQRSTDGDSNIGRFRLSATDQPGETVRSVKTAPLEDLAAARVGDAAAVEPKLRARLFEQFLEDHAPYREAKGGLDRATRQLDEVKKASGKLNVMVLAERKEPRDTFVLVRGVWDKHGDKVPRDVPAAIAPWPAGEEKTRLGLARWVISRDNPLTARVVVNHLWQMLFGAGLVRTPEDFGLQGERPTHHELLDWLAVEFMDGSDADTPVRDAATPADKSVRVTRPWDIKHLLTLMATSSTYRQDSAVSPALLARDPENRLLARGSRFRLPSWMLRDSALRSAGLLNPALGGPPVRPYQPGGVWEEMFMGRFRYEPSEGAAQYRRTLYAFWRRAIAPTFLFDSAQRRVCEVRTARTNTPLHALTLLNDETFLEASRALATQMLRQPGDTNARLQFLSRRVLSRAATDREIAVLQRELDRALAHYRAQPGDAARFLQFGQTSPVMRTLLSALPATQETADRSVRLTVGVSLPELAAGTIVASLMLNLDEAITHE